jgi:leucyl aminopeptidase
VITLTRAEGSLAEGQAPLKVAWAKEGRLLSQGEALDARLGGLLRRALEGASLKEGESLLVAAPEGQVLLFGLGEDARSSGGRLAQALLRLRFPEALVEPLPEAYALAEGLLLGAYRFDRHRSEKEEKALTLRLPGADEVLERARKVAEGVYLARDLVNEPPNLLTPLALAERALELGALGVEVEVLDEEAIASLGMGAFLAVAQGSENPPRFIRLRYAPPRGQGPAGPGGEGPHL